MLAAFAPPSIAGSARVDVAAAAVVVVLIVVIIRQPRRAHVSDEKRREVTAKVDAGQAQEDTDDVAEEPVSDALFGALQQQEEHRVVPGRQSRQAPAEARAEPHQERAVVLQRTPGQWRDGHAATRDVGVGVIAFSVSSVSSSVSSVPSVSSVFSVAVKAMHGESSR